MTQPPAGWYPDPQEAANVRYWDGQAWTAHVQPRPVPAPPPAPSPDGATTPAPSETPAHPGATFQPGAQGATFQPGAQGATFQPGGAVGSVGASAAATSTPEKRRNPLVLILAIGLPLLLVAGAGAAYALGVFDGGDDPGVVPSTTPSATAAADPGPTAVPDVVVPDGWELFSSRSGAILYARDPEWQDLFSDELETTTLEGAFGAGGPFEAELAGVWLTGDALAGEATTIIVFAGTTGLEPPSMESEVTDFAESSNAGMGDEVEVTNVLDEAYESPQGYEGWRIDSRLVDSTGTTFASVIGLEHNRTEVFLYVLSTEEPSAWTADVEAVADSLVVAHTPQSPE